MHRLSRAWVVGAFLVLLVGIGGLVLSAPRASSGASDAATSAPAPTGASPDTSTPVPAPAGSTLARVRSSGVLTIGTEGTYSPFSYQDDAGDLTGYDVDVISAVAKRMGVTPRFTQAPFDALFASLGADRFDLIANQVTDNPEREGLYALSDPYTYSQGVVITRADDDSITSLKDLDGATTAQSSTSNWYQVAKDAGAKTEAVEGFAQAVALVKQGRVDATVNDSLAALEYFRTTGDTDVKISARIGDVSKQVFAMRPADTSLRDEVNRQLAALQSDGTLKTLSEKYFGQDVSVPSDGSAAASDQPTTGSGTDTRRSTVQLLLDTAGPMALAAIRATIPLTIISFVIGLVIAVVIALMRLSSVPVLSQIARFYVSIIRGTPLLVQLYLIFYGLPQIGIDFDPFLAATIAFSLNVGGYAAEIVRGAILAVPEGQREAAVTLGFGYRQTLQRIVLPQAARIAVPPLSNTLISLVKDTSLASIVLVTDLLRVAQVAAAPSFRFFALYSLAALYYWIICLVLSFVQARVERRLERSTAR